MIPIEYVSLPANSEAEITLLGAGAYGECLVIHCGLNEWVIVDSCIDPNNKNFPLALSYLEDIGVSLNNVVCIVCTHWHDDHIRGLSKILKSCPNAEFCISRANDLSKFFAFIGLDAGKPSSYSTREFSNSLELLIERNKQFVDAKENRLLHKNIFSQIFSLSPSDYTCEQFDHEIGSLLKEFGEPNKRIPYRSPNFKSIVLLLKLGNYQAILGADLEVGFDENEGWKRIVKNKFIDKNQASLLKISHHGSENGFHEDIWKLLLTTNPVAKLTPWKIGENFLPNDIMIDKYISLTPRLYITAHPTSNKQKKRPQYMEKYIKQHLPNLQEIKYSPGIIRSRIIMDQENSTWNVELIMGAKNLK